MNASRFTGWEIHGGLLRCRGLFEIGSQFVYKSRETIEFMRSLEGKQIRVQMGTDEMFERRGNTFGGVIRMLKLG